MTCYPVFLTYLVRRFLILKILGESSYHEQKIVTLGLASASLLVLGACGNRSEKSSSKSETKVAMIADVGGIDDKSFNQSVWEGLQAWGKENDLKKVRVLTTSNQVVRQIMLITWTLQLQVATT